jgi:methylmalonyl-CoA/ethylmalonyl-CoA epimerase
VKLGRLNHVGVATPSIEQSLEIYRTLFGAEPHGEPFDLPAQGSASASSTRPIRRSS